jgi:hypothetical protein
MSAVGTAAEKQTPEAAPFISVLKTSNAKDSRLDPVLSIQFV